MFQRILRGANIRQGMRIAVADVRRFSSSSIIPVIDIGQPKQEAARQISKACEEIGFLSIVNHGVPKPVMDNMWRTTQQYFDCSVEDKMKIPMTEDYPYGYCGMGEENLSKGYDKDDAKPDLKECFCIGPHNPDAGMPARRWPEDSEMRAAWETYWNEMETLSLRVLRLFALGLELPEHWFEDKVLRHRSALRALNYPMQTTPPEPGQLRAGEHTDYGSITILKQDSAGGLQVRDRHQQWHDVPYMEDAFVVNLGDLMPRWTNDRWVSTLHRVVNPPFDNGNRRQSVAFFHNIDHDHLVECIPTCTSADNPPKYPPILFWDHLMEKHLASTGGK